MSELFFVVKCLFFTALLVVFMQLKVHGTTIENYSYRWLKESPTSQYIQSVAAGGAMALRHFGRSMKDGVASTVDSYQQGAAEQAHR